MNGTATVTGKEAGGITVTSKVFNNIHGITFNIDRNLVSVLKSDGNTENIDITGATTITSTVASGVFAFTVS